MPEPRLNVASMKIYEILEDYQTGRLAVPEFQRDYVWRKSKAPKLLDSLYRGYPVSSILLWEADDPAITPRRNEPRALKGPTVRWLIDGQQRVMTLHRIRQGEIEVMFNPSNGGQFSLVNAANRNQRGWFCVADLWDDDRYRQISSDATESAARCLENVRRIFKEYEIPVVNMRGHNFEGAVEAFKRINTQGVRLGSNDIQSAEIAAKHSRFIAKEVLPFLEEVHGNGFDRLTIMHLFRVCAFLATPDERTRTPLRDLRRATLLEAWKRTTRATERVIGALRDRFGFVDMNVLWSGTLVVPLIIMVAMQETENKVDFDEALGWMALAAIRHRYTGSVDTALTQDLRACRRDDPIAALLKNLRDAEKGGELGAGPGDFQANLGDRGAMLAAYIACRHRGMKSFRGQAVAGQAQIDRHHIWPRRHFDSDKRHLADTVANIAFTLEEDNRSIGAEIPENYLAKIPPNVLDSQCIPNDRDLWKGDAKEEFWQERRRLLAEAFNDFVRKHLPHRKIL